MAIYVISFDIIHFTKNIITLYQKHYIIIILSLLLQIIYIMLYITFVKTIIKKINKLISEIAHVGYSF